MKKRKALISIGIALIMLIFSLIAAMVIFNISSNLYKNIIKMDVRKESQYKKIVIMSLKNSTDYLNDKKNQTYFNDLSEASRTWNSNDFQFSTSEKLSQGSGLSITFPATISLAATAVETGSATLNFFELFTKPDLASASINYSEDEYGIIVQYDIN